MINLSQAYLACVKNILQKFVVNAEVRVFGSRLARSVKPYSDLDLVVIDTHKLELVKLYQLRDAFEESELPFRVDVLDWNRISEQFKQIIQQNYEVLQVASHS